MGINLLKETIEFLNDNGKEVSDVAWVGNDSISTSWESFEKIADINYDNGFGGQKINPDLMIVGKDWWIERHEYDGSEWWEFKRIPIESKDSTISLIHILNKYKY